MCVSLSSWCVTFIDTTKASSSGILRRCYYILPVTCPPPTFCPSVTPHPFSLIMKFHAWSLVICSLDHEKTDGGRERERTTRKEDVTAAGGWKACDDMRTSTIHAGGGGVVICVAICGCSPTARKHNGHNMCHTCSGSLSAACHAACEPLTCPRHVLRVFFAGVIFVGIC